MPSFYDFAPREVQQLPFALKRSQLYPPNPPSVDQGIEFFIEGRKSDHYMPQATGFTKWKTGPAAQDFAGPARSAVAAVAVRQEYVDQIVDPITASIPLYTRQMVAADYNFLPVYDSDISQSRPIARGLLDRSIVQAASLDAYAMQVNNKPWVKRTIDVVPQTLLDTAQRTGFANVGLAGLCGRTLGSTDPVQNATMTLWGAVGVLGAATGAYHGYKRNNSIGWAIGWAVLGGIFPIITIPLSLAQGFGKRKGR